MKPTTARHPNNNETALLTQATWQRMQEFGKLLVAQTPQLAALGREIILESDGMAEALSRLLSRQQLDPSVGSDELAALFRSVYAAVPELADAATLDLVAVAERDPAVTDILVPFLYFKGFHSLQMHRVAQHLWNDGQRHAALFLQNRSSVLYGVDIHPAARIGTSVMFDHATGIVIGETAVVENNVSILHGVTLGGTGKERGDRHPKIREGVMIGAGAKILGNIEVGPGASIAAGSVVLHPVPAHTTVAGVPAKIVGRPKSCAPSEDMDQMLGSNDVSLNAHASVQVICGKSTATAVQP